MKKLIFILFLIASISMLGQFTFKNGSGTIDVYEYTTLKSSMSKTGLEVTYAGAWLRFVQGGKVINRYKFVDVDTPSYNTIDSLVVVIRGWITSTGDTNLWAISNGHLYPLQDTVVVGNVTIPTSIFEVSDLIKFGNNNAFLGKETGHSLTSGTENTALGYRSGYKVTTGSYNSLFGSLAGVDITSGTRNVLFGYGAGASITNGAYNTLVGMSAGYKITGSQNICIGYQAGFNETGSYKLYVDVTNTASPLIYGEFDNDFVKINGGFAKDYDIKTADYTIGLGDYTIQQQTASTTVTLPSGTKVGQEYGIVNTSSGTITISTDGSDKLGNTGTSTSYSLATGNAVTVRFDGTDRWTLH